MAKIERVIEVFECLLDIDKPCEDTCSYNLGDYRCDTTRLYKETLELLKEQQPKLLTLKETINAKYPMDVFCEIKGEERIFAVTAPVPAQWIGKPDIRYWTARPTKKQRKAEPWKECEQE